MGVGDEEERTKITEKSVRRVRGSRSRQPLHFSDCTATISSKKGGIFLLSPAHPWLGATLPFTERKQPPVPSMSMLGSRFTTNSAADDHHPFHERPQCDHPRVRRDRHESSGSYHLASNSHPGNHSIQTFLVLLWVQRSGRTCRDPCCLHANHYHHRQPP